MGCGCGTINNTCGEALYAACMYYEGALPLFTTLVEKECYSVEEIIADIYQIESIILEEINLEELQTNSIDYELLEGKIVVKKALKAHAEMLLSLQELVDNLTQGEASLFDISDWGLDFGCIADTCDNPPTKLKNLIQLLITEICDLKARVTDLETV